MKSTKELRVLLETSKYEDFHNGNVERVHKELEVGDFFITDYLGNELSLCKVIKERKKVNDWKKAVELIEVLIPNCLEKYGSSINGPFLVPK